MSWTFIGSTNSDGDGDTSGATTSALDTTGADLLVALVGHFSDGTFTDSEGNTWVALTDRDAGNPALAPYYCINPTTSASHTFDYSGALVFPGVIVLAFSSSVGEIQFGSEVGNVDNASSIACGSLTPSANGALLIAAQAVDSDATDQSINLSYTETDDLSWTNNVQMGVAAAYLEQTTAAAINPTWTGGSSQQRASSHFYFLESADLFPTGISSDEAFGSPSVENLTINPGGIASDEAIGSLIIGLDSDFVISPTGISSDEAFGTHVLNNAIQPTGITSDEVVPGPLVVTGHERKPIVIGNGILQQIQDGDTLLVPTALIVDNAGTRSSIQIKSTTELETSGDHSYIIHGIDSNGSDSFAIPAFTRSSGCIGIGQNAGTSITSGQFNFCIGHNTLANLSSGSNNVAVGNSAAFDLTQASNVVAIGTLAGSNLTTGANCIYIGTNAGLNKTTQSNGVGIGVLALSAAGGQQQVGIGTSALRDCTGNFNTGIGADSGRGVTSGTNNTFVGNSSGRTSLGQPATASNTTCIGYQAVASGSNQVVIGNSNVTDTILRGDVQTDGSVTMYDTTPPTAQPAFITAVTESHSLGTNYSASEIQDALDALAVAINDLREMAIDFGFTAPS